MTSSPLYTFVSAFACAGLGLLGCESSSTKSPGGQAQVTGDAQSRDETSPADPAPSASGAGGGQAKEAKASEVPPRPSKGLDVQDFDSLVRKKPRAELLEKWGESASSTEFKIGDGVPEFRIELYNDFPPGDPASAEVRIKEDTWRLDGYRFTMWSHQPEGRWQALQAVSYVDGVQF